MQYMVAYLTRQMWLDYNLYVRPEQQGYGGGMAVKTQRTLQALGTRYNVQPAAEAEDIDAPIVLVEPLYFQLGEKPAKKEEKANDKLDALIYAKENQRLKLILACSEFELMRWSNEFRNRVVEVFDIITCNCYYQRNMFRYFDVEADAILCDPVPTQDVFYPSKEAHPQSFVLATGHVSWQKHTEAVIDIFAELRKSDIRTAYIGSADLWGRNTNPYNNHLEKELKKVTTDYHPSLSQQEVADMMRKATVGLWYTHHECFGTGYAEMLSTGLPVIAGDHGLRGERPAYATAKPPADAIMSLLTDDALYKKWSEKSRTWAVKNVDYEIYLNQFAQILRMPV